MLRRNDLVLMIDPLEGLDLEPDEGLLVGLFHVFRYGLQAELRASAGKEASFAGGWVLHRVHHRLGVRPVVDQGNQNALRAGIQIALDVLLQIHTDANDRRHVRQLGGPDHVLCGLVVHRPVLAVHNDEIESRPAHHLYEAWGRSVDKGTDRNLAFIQLLLEGILPHGVGRLQSNSHHRRGTRGGVHRWWGETGS